MTNPIITIHNIATGEIEQREMNAEELKQYETDQAQLKLANKLEHETQIAKQAILNRLGITAEEAALLLK